MSEALHQRFLRKTANSPFIEKVCVQLLHMLRPSVMPPSYCSPGQRPANKSAIGQKAPIFISGRFRSGSTLLWQAFIRLAGYTAYYEPLNEQQWFSGRQRRDTDNTHRGVTDYSENYDGLEHLGAFFTKDWTYAKLAMDAKSKDDNMRVYIKALIEVAAERPVLQFNRVDYRLPFLREHFPDACIVHLSRNVRDVWRSTLKGAENDKSWKLGEFEPYSHFYLLPQYRDLMISFPWLRLPADSHPYGAHYLLWRLSELYAVEYADVFVSYEDLCSDFEKTIERLLQRIGHKVSAKELLPLDGLMQKKPDTYDHSGDLAFYESIEAQAEKLLQEKLPTSV